MPLRPEFIYIHGIAVTNITLAQALERVVGSAQSRPAQAVFYVNADCINISSWRADYRSALLDPDALIFGDGTGIRIAGMISGQPVLDNVNGTDMFPLLCAEAETRGLSVFLLGAEPGVAARASEAIRARHPGLRLAGVHHGYFDLSRPSEIIDLINRCAPDLLFVGLGAPRQELFIAAHLSHIDAGVVLGVGGLFDFLSGRTRRAPPGCARLGSSGSTGCFKNQAGSGGAT